MNLLIFGATRGCGRQLVDQALTIGHQVTAFSRNAAAVPPRPNLTVVTGDALNTSSVNSVLAGSKFDAVLSGLGSAQRGKDKVCSLGTQNILAAMKQHGPRRLLVVSSIGVEPKFLSPMVKYLVVGVFLAEAHRDLRLMEDAITTTELDWTIVRPPRLLDGPRTGTYRVQLQREGSYLNDLNRADVADFMLRELAQSQYVRKAPCLGY